MQIIDELFINEIRSLSGPPTEHLSRPVHLQRNCVIIVGPSSTDPSTTVICIGQEKHRIWDGIWTK